MIDAHDEHRSISRRSGNDHFLGAGRQMSFGSLDGREKPGGFHHIISIHLCPLQIRRFLLGGHSYFISVHDQLVLTIQPNSPFKTAMR